MAIVCIKEVLGISYYGHLLANWRVVFHSLNDFSEHFLHGLISAILQEHNQHNEDMLAIDVLKKKECSVMGHSN